MSREKNITPQVLALQAAYQRGADKKLWKGLKQCAIALRMKPTKFDSYYYGYITRQEKIVALTEKIDRFVKGREPAELHPLLRKLRQTYARGKKAQAWTGPADCALRIGMNKNTLRSQLSKTGQVLHTRLSGPVKDTIQRMERVLPRGATDHLPMHEPPQEETQDLAKTLIEMMGALPLPATHRAFDAGAEQIAKGINIVLKVAAQAKEQASELQDALTHILQGIASGCVSPRAKNGTTVISAPLADLLVAGYAELRGWKKDGIRFVPMGKIHMDTLVTTEEMEQIRLRVQEVRRLLLQLNSLANESLRELAAQKLGPELRFLVIAIQQASEVIPRDVQEYLKEIDRARREAEKLL